MAAASSRPETIGVPCAPQYCSSMAIAAEPQPSSVCLMNGTSSQTPADSACVACVDVACALVACAVVCGLATSVCTASAARAISNKPEVTLRMCSATGGH